jgi:hypothetical protein
MTAQEPLVNLFMKAQDNQKLRERIALLACLLHWMNLIRCLLAV